MGILLVKANEATASRRTVYFDLRDATDGITAETGEASGQPQISTNGGAWADTGIGTLTHMGNGRYYAIITQTAIATAGNVIETRFKSANTAETPGTSLQVVGYDPADSDLGLTPGDFQADVSGLSTFDASSDEVATDAASRNASKATGFATPSDIAGITQAQRVRLILPTQIERPDAGSETYRLYIYAYDSQHVAENLDNNPTVAAENASGVDRSSNLGSVVKPSGTGVYYVDYTLSQGDSIEQLIFKVTATEGSVATEYATATQVVDTTAVDFTAADRTKLEAISGADGAVLATSQPNYAPNTTTPPTVDQIDTKLTTEHGAGSWTTGSGGGGGSGSGANSVTITMNDGSSPLESVNVRVTKGAVTYVAPSNVSGEASFSLDDGSWVVSATLPGYTFAGTTIVVNGTEAETYSMTATGLSVPTSPRIRSRLLVLDAATKLGKSGVDLTVVVAGPASDRGYGSEVVSQTVTSDSNGLAEWYALPGESYLITGPNSVEHSVKVPADATDPHSMESIRV